MSTPIPPNHVCSFCGKQQSQVRHLIAGPSSASGVWICDECVRLCNEILDEEERAEAERGKGPAQWRVSLVPPEPPSSPMKP